MKNNAAFFVFLTALVLLTGTAHAGTGTFTSTGSGDWNQPSTWIYSNDADGIPDLDDDITILSGHKITITSAGAACNLLTVNDTLVIDLNATLSVYGDYILNGAERGLGTLIFMSGNPFSISGSGDFGNFVKYDFSAGAEWSVSPGSTIKKYVDLTLAANAYLTNYGNLNVKDVIGMTGAALINETGGLLTLNTNNVMAGGQLDVSADDNTVVMRTGGNIPATVGNTFHDLIMMDNVFPLVLNDETTIEGDLSFLGTGMLNQNERNMTVSGNILQTSTGGIQQQLKEYLILDGYLYPQNITATTMQLRGLKIANSNGVTLLSGSIELAAVLTLADGDLTINPGAGFTLLSNATETARIDEITGTSTINGLMSIQRYITGSTEGRDTSWVDVSSPVVNSTFADWSDDISITFSTGNNATATWYNETTDGFVPVSSASAPVVSGKGYELFLADDSTHQTWSGATLTTVGTPNTGDQFLSTLTYTPGNSNFNLVGNPFQSSVSWPTLLSACSGIANTFWYYDHNAGTYSVGGMQDEIPAGQGFWVLTTETSPQFIVPEAAKVASPNSTLKNLNEKFPYALITISGTENHFSHQLRVGPAQNATEGYDNNLDFPFLKSPNRKAPEIYAGTPDGKKVVVFAFSEETQEITIPVTIRVGETGTYKIAFDRLEYLSNYTCALLVDTRTGKSYDMISQAGITLELDAADRSEGRFEIRLKESGCPAQAVSGMQQHFKAWNNGSQVMIDFNYDETTPVEVNITNALGQQILTPMQMEAAGNTQTLTLPADFSGMFLITVTHGNQVQSQKLVKN